MRSDAALLVLALALSPLAVPRAAPAADDAKDKKPEKKPEPPRLIVTMPPAIPPGRTNTVHLRGNALTDATDVTFTNAALHAQAVIKTKTRIEVPKDADARKVGDAQLELEVVFPADAPTGTHWLTVASTNGVSAPHPLVLLPAAELIEEHEPNGGFKQAQPIAPGRTILGTVKEPADVDVFRFPGRAGQRVRVEVTAARLGSTLDSLVTLYDSGGHILTTNDDAAGGADSLLAATLPADGDYFVSLIDAQDRGGPTHVYLMKLSVER